MIQYFSIITCDKCLKQEKVLISKQDLRETIGGMPKKVNDLIRLNNSWRDLPDDKHICRSCRSGFEKMISSCNKLKREYWGK